MKICRIKFRTHRNRKVIGPVHLHPTTLLICEAFEKGFARRGHRKRKTHAKLAHLKSFAPSPCGPPAFGFRDFRNIAEQEYATFRVRYTSGRALAWLFKLIFKGRSMHPDRRLNPSAPFLPLFFSLSFFPTSRKKFRWFASSARGIGCCFSLKDTRTESVLALRYPII